MIMMYRTMVAAKHLRMLYYQDTMFDYMVPFLRSNSFLSLPMNTLSGL